MSEGKKYGLIIPKRADKSKRAVNPASVFGNDDDDDQEVKTGGARFPMIDTKKAQIKRQVQLEMEKAIAVDPTVYEYDNIYDDLQAKKAMNDKRLAPDISRKPKYIGSLLKAAEQRQRDMERRIEKTVQKEREAEKGLFDDKEAFVTDAYRRKMEEIRLQEERERKQEELEARMDVTKQKDMSAFYRNLLDQTTDTVVKKEPTPTDDATSHHERSQQPVAVAVPGDKDDSDDSSSSSGSSETHSRKHHIQESIRNRSKERKHVHRHRSNISDHSSSESDKHRRKEAKYNERQHSKHDRDDKHSVKTATAEEKQSTNYTSKNSSAVDSESAKDRSGQGRGTETKYRHSKDISNTSSSSRHGELNRQETESRKKRKQDDNVEVCNNSKDSDNLMHHTDSDDGSSKQKRAKTELDQIAVQSKTARQTIGTTFDDARARYLARKGISSAPVVCEDSD